MISKIVFAALLGLVAAKSSVSSYNIAEDAFYDNSDYYTLAYSADFEALYRTTYTAGIFSADGVWGPTDAIFNMEYYGLQLLSYVQLQVDITLFESYAVSYRPRLTFFDITPVSFEPGWYRAESFDDLENFDINLYYNTYVSFL